MVEGLRITRPEHRRTVVMKGTFRDSVFLLRITEKVRRLPGVGEALVGMATDTNKDLAKSLGLWSEELAGAGPDDLVIVVGGSSQEAVEAAIATAKSLMEGGAEESQYSTVEAALAAIPEPTVVLISIPGKYVKDVALPLVEEGINVHVFSDNVPIEDEITLKQSAVKNDCFVFGPGAGTVLIRGVGLGFANKVRIGGVGVAAASGTGLQELSSMLSESGLGISYGLGVGGNDVKDVVGGLMMMKALEFLEEDPSTNVIALVSKIPNPTTKAKVEEFVKSRIKKPCVITFLGPGAKKGRDGRLTFTKTLHQAVASVASLGGGEEPLKAFLSKYHWDFQRTSEMVQSLRVNGRFVALLTGGTFANEGSVVLSEAGVSFSVDLRSGNAVVDLGEEEYTRGRPHPMIDPTIRTTVLRELAKDESVGAVYMDFVLGYGAHHDPAGAHSNAINYFLSEVERSGRRVELLGHVCGTSGDPQGLSEQEDKLKSLGVKLFPTNALAFLTLAGAVTRGGNKLKLVYDETVSIGGLL